jgi:hypothetical protein
MLTQNCEVCQCRCGREWFVGAGKKDGNIHYFCTATHMIMWVVRRYVQDTNRPDMERRLGIVIRIENVKREK